MSKRLYRSEKDKVIGGVCGGIAEYLNVDPTIVRVLFLLALLTEGFGFMLYLILWIVVPAESSIKKDADEVIEENSKEIQSKVVKASKGIKREVSSDTKKK